MEMVTISNIASKAEWLLCPVCHNKTRIKLRQDTTLTHLPLFCPKCKKENLMNVHHLTTTIIKEPVA
jgi:phage FluMu protein Com